MLVTRGLERKSEGGNGENGGGWEREKEGPVEGWKVSLRRVGTLRPNTTGKQ